MNQKLRKTENTKDSKNDSTVVRFDNLICKVEKSILNKDIKLHKEETEFQRIFRFLCVLLLSEIFLIILLSLL